jgi:hypothetical protein
VSSPFLESDDLRESVVATFQKPDSDSIGCYKLLPAPNDLVIGPISRKLCAGYNWSMLLLSADQPDNVPSARTSRRCTTAARRRRASRSIP